MSLGIVAGKRCRLVHDPATPLALIHAVKLPLWRLSRVPISMKPFSVVMNPGGRHEGVVRSIMREAETMDELQILPPH